MRHPEQTLSLIRFFLKKRQEVEDYDTPFSFTFAEAREENVCIPTEDKFVATLDRLKKQRYKSERFQEILPVLGSYIIGEDGSTYTVSETTTEGLEEHQYWIRGNMECSCLELNFPVDYYAANVTYLGQTTREPVRKGAFLVLEMLTENFQEIVTYDQFIERFNQVRLMREESANSGKPINRKTIQSAVNGVFARLHDEIGVPSEEILTTNRNQGYTLEF